MDVTHNPDFDPPRWQLECRLLTIRGEAVDSGYVLEPYGISPAEVPMFDAMVDAYAPHIAKVAANNAAAQARAEKREERAAVNKRKREAAVVKREEAAAAAAVRGGRMPTRATAAAAKKRKQSND